MWAKDEIFRVGGNVLYSHTDRKSTRTTATQNLLRDSVSWQDAASRTHDIGHNLNSDFRVQWNIDENNTIEFRPRLSLNFRDSEANDSSLLRAGDSERTKVNRNINAKPTTATASRHQAISSTIINLHPSRDALSA